MEIIKSWQMWFATAISSFIGYQAFERFKVHDSDAGAGLFCVCILLMSSVSFILFNKITPRHLLAYIQTIIALAVTSVLLIYFDQGSVSSRERIPYYTFLAISVFCPTVMMLVIWHLKKAALDFQSVNLKLLYGSVAISIFLMLISMFVVPAVLKLTALQSVQKIESSVERQVNSVLAEQAQRFERPLQAFVEHIPSIIGSNDIAWKKAITQLHDAIDCYKCEVWIGRIDLAEDIEDHLPWQSEKTKLVSSTFQVGANETPPYSRVNRYFVQDIAIQLFFTRQGRWTSNEAIGGDNAMIGRTFVDHRNNVEWAVYISTSAWSLIHSTHGSLSLLPLQAKEGRVRENSIFQVPESESIIVLPESSRGTPQALIPVQSSELFANKVLAITTTAELDRYNSFVKSRGFVLTALIGFSLLLLIFVVNMSATRSRSVPSNTF